MTEEPGSELDLDRFLETPTEEISDWRWLWSADREFPVRARPGVLGSVVVFFKRLLRPLVKSPQADLWDRQRQFNLVLLAHLERVRDLGLGLDELGRDLQRVQKEVISDLQDVRRDLLSDLAKINADVQDLDVALAVFKADGLKDLARHTEGLFSLLDQKVERLRHQAHGPVGGQSDQGAPPSD